MENEVESRDYRSLGRDEQWGVDRWNITCPRCGQDVETGPERSAVCRCGLEWQVETRAVGRPYARRSSAQ